MKTVVYVAPDWPVAYLDDTHSVRTYRQPVHPLTTNRRTTGGQGVRAPG